MTFIAKHISVSIDLLPAQVYEFASNPENLPKWAGGLSDSIKQVNDEWIAEALMGRVKVKFAEKNKFGVLDHEVTLESGVKFYNPMRVIPNNDGLVFTLYRQPDVADQEFAEDTELIEKDLKRFDVSYCDHAKRRQLIDLCRHYCQPAIIIGYHVVDAVRLELFCL